MFKLIKKTKKPITLKEHFHRRNKILIKRRVGGYGDILMQRMLFSELKNTNLDVTYTCPYQFIEMAKNQPYIKVKEISEVNEREYGKVFDITTACRVEEAKNLTSAKHRSDIWADHIGIKLINHEMHLNPLPEYLELAKKEFQSLTNKPIVILSTKSTNDAFGIAKSLLDSQVKNLVKEIKDLGLFPISLNHHNQYVYEQLEVEQRQMIHPQLWIAYIAAADYVISVDTATFHIAGGLKKPLVGIFSFTDGKIYGKYYDFILVQKHRDNGNWPCGPCFNHYECPRELHCPVKPCLTELSFDEIAQGLHSALNKWPWKQTP